MRRARDTVAGRWAEASLAPLESVESVVNRGNQLQHLFVQRLRPELLKLCRLVRCYEAGISQHLLSVNSSLHSMLGSKALSLM